MSSPLRAFQRPLEPAPQGGLLAAQRDSIPHAFPPPSQAQLVLGVNRGLKNQVLGAPDGTALVTCVSDMSGVTPEMIDWWFGWHITEAERYRLWHPTAHISSRTLKDRSSTSNLRTRYIDDISYVDEYIGYALQNLAITFKPPQQFGFSSETLKGSTAICAETSDRKLKSRSGFLVHYVVPTATGSQMRSGFWLGYLKSNIFGLGPVLDKALNTSIARRVLLTEELMRDFLIHCGEEMNHLTKFLPELFASQTDARL